MLSYLYYKLYQASKKSSLKDTPHIAAPIFLGTLITVNLLVLNAFLAKQDAMPFFFSGSIAGGILVILLIAASFVYFQKDRYEILKEKYSRETNRQRVTGNIFAGIYVIASFLAIFAVAFYKPGKL